MPSNTMSGQSGGHRLRLSKLNEQLVCTLCSGYLIDATTIIECFHSFCRSCIVKYLEVNKYCPICEVLVHESKPLLNIRPDHTLQDIVYKLVPGCYQNEMRCRREFYMKHPEGKNLTMSPEARGEPIESHIYSPEESLSLSLEYFNSNAGSDCEGDKEIVTKPLPKRYLRCPAAVTVFHLQKLIRAKYGLSEVHRVDIMYKEEPLCGSYTLMDVMYIYHWRRKVPLHLSYRIFESSTKRIKLSEDNNEFQQSLSNTGISPVESKDEQSTKRGWKEVQLKISETGVMSVTDITSPDSKKSTKTKEIDGQSSSDLLQNGETLESLNKPIALEGGTNAKTSVSKSKNLTSEFDNIKVPQETKRKVNFDSKNQQDSKSKKDAKDLNAEEVEDVKNPKESKEPNKMKDSKESKEVEENKKEKIELPGKSKREELEITSRVPETDNKPGRKQNENPKGSLKKEKNTPSNAGSKIDALSAKLQFQPKVGQVNNTYSKKTLKVKKLIQATKQDAKKDSKAPELPATLSKISEGVSNKNSENASKSSESVSKNLESVSKTAESVSKAAESVPKNADSTPKNVQSTPKKEEIQEREDVSKSSKLSNSTSAPTYVTAPSVSSEKMPGISLQQALNSLAKTGDSKSLLNQLNASQKSSFKNNNVSPSNESLASIGLNVSTAMVMGQTTNYGFMMPELGMMSPGSKSQVSPVSQVQSLSKLQSSSPIQTISIQSSPVQSSSQMPSSSQSKVTTTTMPQFNVQPSMSIYSISDKNNIYNQPSTKSSKSDFEITSVYPIPPSPDSVPIPLMKPMIRKHEVIAKGTNLNEICAKIGTSGSKINDICAKIGENSKEKNKTETRRPDLPDLLKITKSPSSEFLKHIPNIPNVPIYTPSANVSSKDLERKNSVASSGVSTSQKISQKKQAHVGYKTLRDPPKSWNPTLSKNNYVAVKNQSQSQFADGGSSKSISSKPAKIFKMRNMPRYLGNPASGVKPMYGVSTEKEKEQASKSNLSGVNSMNVNAMTMMKIDPKTLSPIVSTANSPIVSPPPYSPNARSYQNSPFQHCRNSGSPISPRNSPVNMLSTNPFIPSPTLNTNPRLIYSHFPPPFPDASRFPNPLIRTPVGVPPPSAFHNSLPPSINKLYQRSSYIPQTSGYNPVTQPPTVQRIPPSTHSSPKSTPTSSVSFNLGKAETVVSTNSEIGLAKEEKVFNFSKSDASDLSEKSSRITLEEKGEKKVEKIDLESKINGDIIDVEVEEKERERREQNESGKETLTELNQSTKELKQASKESSKPNSIDKTNDQRSRESLTETPKEASKDTLAEPSKQCVKESPTDNSKDSLKESAKDSTKDSKNSKEEESKSLQENLLVERSKDLVPQEKIEDVEKEIQGKKLEIQRNKAES